MEFETKRFFFNGVWYLAIKEGVAVVAKKRGGGYNASKLEIMQEVMHEEKTYRVVAISKNAFYNSKNVVEIVIPEGITKIGQSAFAYCKSLKSVTIPKSVKVIDSFVFFGCDSLESRPVFPPNCKVEEFIFPQHLRI